jgi:methionyl-tRNA synthetase
MIERYRGGTVPAGAATSLDTEVAAALVRYRAAMDAQLLHQGLAAIIALSSAANQYVDSRAPWAQAKDPALASELDITLAALARCVAALTVMLQPFMPSKMEQLSEYLGLNPFPMLDDVASIDLAGRSVRRGEILFPKPKT